MTSSGPAPVGSRRAPSRAALALAFAAVFVVWGTTFLAIRYAVETIPPLVAAGARHAAAGSVLFALAWLRGYRPRRTDWIGGSVLGGLFFLAGHGLLHWAEQHIASGLAALLIATEPLWILLVGAALGRQRLNRFNGAGLLLGLLYLVTFGSIITFSAYSWLLQHVPPTLVATHTFVNPVVAVLAGWLWAGEPLGGQLALATAVIVLAVVMVQRGERGRTAENLRAMPAAGSTE